MTTINSLTSLSAKTGIGGLVSGMDIDELINKLTTASKEKILKQQQEIQKLQWKQTAYRNVASALKEFQGKYLDVLSSTNFRSTSFFNTIKVSSSSDAISAISTSSATAGSIVINEITQLASNQTIKSSSAVSQQLQGNLATDGELTASDIDMIIANIYNKSISISLDGKFKTLTFDDTFVSNVYNYSIPPEAEGLANAVQSLIDNAYGVKQIEDRVISVSITDNMLNLTAPGSQITTYAVNEDSTTLSHLGFTHGQSNKLSPLSKLENLPFTRNLNAVDKFVFKINSVEFAFNKTDSLSTVLSRINASNAGVTISYSSITDKFAITAKESGTGENIVIQETQGNLMAAFGLTDETNPLIEYGKNALLKANGNDLIRSSNSIIIDGVKVELLKETQAGDDPIKITMKEDASSLLEPIKKFVEDYNSMISLINGLSKEKAYNDYPPLSDEQKEEMTETQIKNWEEKAKAGILRGDQILKSISFKMQSLMYSPAVEGGITLHELGITSADYTENGKLKITESDLINALETKGTEIKQLFTSEKGLATVLNQIITGAIKTSGVRGDRGTLIEMAGIAATTSDTQNSITDKIEKKNKTISALQLKLSREEERLWNKFTAMETALQRLNGQSMILSQFSENPTK